MERKYLHPGERFVQNFDVNGGGAVEQRIEILEKMGEGSSCVSYSVKVGEGKEHRKMVLKQFYPDFGAVGEYDGELDGLKLHIKDYEKTNAFRLGERFQAAYLLQNELATQNDETMNFVVKPIFRYFQGSTLLVLYEANYGKSMNHYMDGIRRNCS